MIWNEEQGDFISVASLPNHCMFTFQTAVYNSIVLNATLGVYVQRHKEHRNEGHHGSQAGHRGGSGGQRPLQSSSNHIPTIFVNKVEPSGKTVVIAKQRIHAIHRGAGAWFQFDIRTSVVDWISDPESNFGIQIVVGGGYRVVIDPPKNSDEDLYVSCLEC